MREKKYEVNLYALYNKRGIEDHLKKMARKGWMLDAICWNGMYWVYHHIEPQEVQFEVSYFPKASVYDSELTEQQQTLHDFCAHAGWELVATLGQLQIFRTEKENPIPIETDPVLAVEAIHATFKRVGLLLYGLLLIWSVVMCMTSSLGYEELADPVSLATSVAVLLLALLCVGELGFHFIWHAKAKKAAAEGIFLDPPDTNKFQCSILLADLLVFGYMGLSVFFNDDPKDEWALVAMMGYMVALIMLVRGATAFMKKKKVATGVNRTLTTVISFVLSFAMMGGVTWGLFWASDQGFFDDPEEETYEYNGRIYTVQNDALPIVLEDLTAVDYTGYQKKCRGEESFLLGYWELSQYPRWDAPNYPDIPQLEYDLVVVKAPFLYGWCKAQLIRQRETRYVYPHQYRPEDPAPWGANEVYRLYDPDYGAEERYLLCYDRTLVEVRFDWEVTPEQKAIVGEKLGK